MAFQASFHADNPTGFYSVSLIVSARACGVLALGANYRIAFDYYTGCCLAGNGGSSSRGTGTGTGRPATTPSSPPIPAAPSVSQALPPSTSTNTGSPAPATPSSTPASAPTQALRASTRPLPNVTWLGLAAALTAVALAAGLSWYRRRPHRPADQ